MNEPAEQPLLAEQPEETKKPTKRRTPAAKPRATKTVKAAKAESTPKTKKVTNPKAAKKKTPAEPEAAPVETPVPAPEVPAPQPAAAKPAIDEWSPSAAVPAETPAPAPMAPLARKYPVYVPRSVAKQFEAEGKAAPISIASSDQATEEILAAVAAAAPPHAQPRHHREQHQREPHPREQQHRDQRRSQSRGPIPQALAEDVIPEPLPAIVDPSELSEGEGIVEISGKGFGFIRDAKRGYAQTAADIFVTPEIVRSFGLRDGQWLKGQTRRGPRGAQLHKLLEINGDAPETVKNLPVFDELTVISPEKRIRLETVPDRYTTRIVDMFCPIGKGQRGLIVAPPRTGKTTLLQHIGDAVLKNHPEVKLLILLVDERPEEVTDIRRNIVGAELYASSNDMDVKSHTRIAQLCIERAKRLVEQGKDVFILLDSITRVGRAFNNATAGGGRTGSGGLDTRAMEIPRRLFAAARNTEEAGSLTIIGTVLIETNSRMDEVIFQEFKGTGNMELCLDRRISEQRIYPAIDIFLSGTRREELLIGEEDLRKIAIIRRGLSGYKPIEAIERLLFFAKKFPTNAEMLAGIPG